MPPIPVSSSRIPKVSVVTAAYNRVGEIGAAIESMLAQDYDDYEIIVVNDGSTDGTDDVVKKYGDHVRLVSQKNGGVGAARNAGIRASRGQYLAYCDADDEQVPYRLRAQVELLDKLPDIAMVFTDFYTWIDGKEVVDDSHLRRVWLGPTIRGFETEVKEHFQTHTNCRELGLTMPDEFADRPVYYGQSPEIVALMHLAWGCVQMTRIEHVRAVGGHWEEVRAYEDWCLTADLSKKHPIAYIDAPSIRYRVHEDQLTGRSRLNCECYRDVIEHTWAGDPIFYGQHRELVNLIRATAYAQLGELEAKEGNFRKAETNFRTALRADLKLKRAWLNLGLAGVRNRAPGPARSILNRVLPNIIESKSDR